MKAIGWLKSVTKKLFTDQSRYLADNTITGQNLSFREIRDLTRVLNLQADEKIQIIWSYTGSYSLKNNVIIGITNHQIFKWENGNISDQIRRDLILQVNHISYDSMTSWDKLQCELTNGGFITFGIFHSSACQYFYEYLMADHIKPSLPTWVGSVKIPTPVVSNIKKSASSPQLQQQSQQSVPQFFLTSSPIAIPSLVQPVPSSFDITGTPIAFNPPGLTRETDPISTLRLGDSPAMVFRCHPFPLSYPQPVNITHKNSPSSTNSTNSTSSNDAGEAHSPGSKESDIL